MSKKLFTIFLIIGISAVQTFASGFQINEHGARAMGMGGAFVGLADDPSATYFNPAGITQLSGLRFSLGATYIKPSSTFTGPSPSTTESKLKNDFFYPANFYATYEAGNDFWIGFAYNSPFGLGTEWADDWVGRYYTTKTEIRTFNFSPTIAYKVNDQFSAAASLTVSYADVVIDRKFPASPAPDASLDLKGNATSFGFNVGLHFKAMEKFSLGLAFHSQIKYKFKGDATPSVGVGTPDAYKSVILGKLPTGSISAPLTVPYVLTFGLAYHPLEALVITGDFQYNAWSSYDKLEVTFNDLPQGPTNPSVSIRDYKNSFIARLGGEYKVNDPLAIRAGFLYDKNPVPDAKLDPTLPDADRIGLNIGVGYKLTEKLSVDLAYFYLIFMERTIDVSEELLIPILPESATNPPFNGTYKSNANLIGLNFSYSL